MKIIDILMNLEDIQPSQLYINSQKVENILKWFTSGNDSYDAIPIKRLNGNVIITDGHTRGLLLCNSLFQRLYMYGTKTKIINSKMLLTKNH